VTCGAGLAEQFSETGLHRGRGLAGGRVPDRLIHDLDLGEAVEACVQYLLRYRPEVNGSVAEMAPAEQHVAGQRNDPVTELIADDPPAGAGNVGTGLRIPPDVVRSE